MKKEIVKILMGQNLFAYIKEWTPKQVEQCADQILDLFIQQIKEFQLFCIGKSGNRKIHSALEELIKKVGKNN